MRERLKLILGDITQLAVDAIVTAANESLMGGHGVDGAVHRAAGPHLFAECRTIGYCAEGDAKLTRGYNLPAKYVIHTVGPVWEGGMYDEHELLHSCYQRSLELAREQQFATVAFPCIATGAHEYPRELACQVAVDAVTHWITHEPLPQQIIFCCFEEADYELYRAALNSWAANAPQSAPTPNNP